MAADVSIQKIVDALGELVGDSWLALVDRETGEVQNVMSKRAMTVDADLENTWRQYRSQALRQMAIDWCEEHHVDWRE